LYARNPLNVAWISMEEGYFWTCLINGYRIGKKSTFENGRPSEYSITPGFAILDTGTSLTYLPSSNAVIYDNNRYWTLYNCWVA